MATGEGPHLGLMSRFENKIDEAYRILDDYSDLENQYPVGYFGYHERVFEKPELSAWIDFGEQGGLAISDNTTNETEQVEPEDQVYEENDGCYESCDCTYGENEGPELEIVAAQQDVAEFQPELSPTDPSSQDNIEHGERLGRICAQQLPPMPDAALHRMRVAFGGLAPPLHRRHEPSGA